MIKVLYISYNAITEPVVQSQVIPYLRGLSEKGIKFYLLTYEKNKINHEGENKIKKKFQKDFDWFYLKYHKRPTAPATLFDIAVGCIYCFYIATRNRVDIIHARAIVGALVGYPAAKLLFKKFIFDTRGIDSEEYVDAGLWKRGGFKHRVAGFLENAITRSSNYVIVLTEAFLEILKKKYSKTKINYSVIPCTVDTDRFKMSQHKDTSLAKKLQIENKFVITYTGSLGTWYMFYEMIDFFKTASKVITNSHFLILTQTDKNYAIDILKKHNLDEKNFTVYTVTYDSMPDFLALCDIGLFFIKPVFSKISSSPVKFGEYLASGLPVVINYGIGDTEKIVKDNKVGVVVESFDESGYVKALNELSKLLKDAGLSARCRQIAERYLSLDSATREYATIYENLTK